MLWFTCVEAIRVLGMQKVWHTLVWEEYSKIRPWLASSQQGLFTPNPAALPQRDQRVRGYCFTSGHKASCSQISGSMQTWAHLNLQAQTWPWMSWWTCSSEGTHEWQSGATKYSQFSTPSQPLSNQVILWNIPPPFLLPVHTSFCSVLYS